jgi:hypothetical protein
MRGDGGALAGLPRFDVDSVRDLRSRRAEIGPSIRRQGAQWAVRSIEQGEHVLAGEGRKVEHGRLPGLGGGTALVGGISGELDGTKRNVMHVQVVRVPVQTLGTECEDHVRPNRSNL